MANVNVPQDNRRAKLKRRRREINRMIEKMRAAGGDPAELERTIRDLKKEMRYAR
jgi:hypothetical protein